MPNGKSADIAGVACSHVDTGDVSSIAPFALTSTAAIGRIRQTESMRRFVRGACVEPMEQEGTVAVLYGGCDLGVVSAKATIINDNGFLVSEIMPYTGFPQKAAAGVIEKVLGRAGVAGNEVDRWLSTGFGGKAVPCSDGVVPDTVCLQRAIRTLNPRVRTIVNVGGHSFTAFYIDSKGALGESAITDFCTAGMGMLLEMISAALEVPLDEPVQKSGSMRNPVFIDNQCPVFAESEAISLINDGYDRNDVFAGVVSAVANKIAGQVRRLGIVEEVAMVGGVAKNPMVMALLGKNLRVRFADLRGIDPQVVAAYGAALLAREGCSLDSESLSTVASERLHREGKS